MIGVTLLLTHMYFWINAYFLKEELLTSSLVDIAKTVFQSLDEFIKYHGIVFHDHTTVQIPLICLYEIYCEQSDNLLDFGTFCATILGNTKSKAQKVTMHCNDPFYFRERTIAYVYRQKKESRFQKIPRFR